MFTTKDLERAGFELYEDQADNECYRISGVFGVCEVEEDLSIGRWISDNSDNEVWDLTQEEQISSFIQFVEEQLDVIIVEYVFPYDD